MVIFFKSLSLLAAILFMIGVRCDPNDLLNGKGSLSDLSLWTVNSSAGTNQTYSLLNQSGTIIMQITKPDSANTSFYDGIYTTFTPTKVGHIRFNFSSTNFNIEDTNLRLKSSTSSLTALSFRCGYAGFVRVNDNQIVDFYNHSISSPDSVYLSQMDVLLDWEQKTVNIYLNGTYKGTANFYHTPVENVDTIMMYNLNPGTTGFFSSIQLCQDKCPGFTFATKSIISFGLLLCMLLMIQLI